MELELASDLDSGTRRDARTCLVALLAVYWVLAFGYLLTIPPWEAPDEPAHFLRIRDLACRLPTLADEPWTCAGPRPARELGVWTVQPLDGEGSPGSCRELAPSIRKPWERRHLYSSYMNRRPPLGHLAAAPWFAWRGAVPLPVLVHPVNPRVRTPVFLQGLNDDPAIAPLVRDLKLLRLPAILWGLVAVAGVWTCGRLLVPGKPGVALVAAALVAFLPQFTFVSAYLNSDVLAIAVSAWLTAWVLLGLSSRRLLPFWGWTAGVLTLLVLAVGSRLNSAGLSFTVAGAISVVAFRRGGWPGLGRTVAALAGLAVLGALAVRSAMPAVWDVFFEHARGSLRWGDARPLPVALDWIATSFVGVFGWMRIRLPPAVYWVVAAWVVLLAVLTVAWWRRPGEDARNRRISAGVLALGIAATALTTLLHAVSIGQPQGRYLFPALPALAALAGAALCGRLPARRGTRRAAGLMLLLAAGNAAILQGALRPAYEALGGDRLSRLGTSSGPLVVQHGLRAGLEDGARRYPFDRRGQVLVANPGPARSLRLSAELVGVGPVVPALDVDAGEPGGGSRLAGFRPVDMTLCSNRGRRIATPGDFEVELPAGGALTFQLPALLVEHYRGFELILRVL